MHYPFSNFNKKTTLLVTLFLSSVVYAQRPMAVFHEVKDLRAACNSKNPTQGLLCYAYLQGVMDTYSDLAFDLNTSVDSRGVPLKLFRMDLDPRNWQGLPLNSVKAIVTQYLNTHPERYGAITVLDSVFNGLLQQEGNPPILQPSTYPSFGH